MKRLSRILMLVGALLAALGLVGLVLWTVRGPVSSQLERVSTFFETILETGEVRFKNLASRTEFFFLTRRTLLFFAGCAFLLSGVSLRARAAVPQPNDFRPQKREGVMIGVECALRILGTLLAASALYGVVEGLLMSIYAKAWSGSWPHANAIAHFLSRANWPEGLQKVTAIGLPGPTDTWMAALRLPAFLVRNAEWSCAASLALFSLTILVSWLRRSERAPTIAPWCAGGALSLLLILTCIVVNASYKNRVESIYRPRFTGVRAIGAAILCEEGDLMGLFYGRHILAAALCAFFVLMIVLTLTCARRQAGNRGQERVASGQWADDSGQWAVDSRQSAAPWTASAAVGASQGRVSAGTQRYAAPAASGAVPGRVSTGTQRYAVSSAGAPEQGRMSTGTQRYAVSSPGAPEQGRMSTGTQRYAAPSPNEPPQGRVSTGTQRYAVSSQQPGGSGLQPYGPNGARRFDAPNGQGAMPFQPGGITPQFYGPNGARRFDAPNGQGAVPPRPSGMGPQPYGPSGQGAVPSQPSGMAPQPYGPSGTRRFDAPNGQTATPSRSSGIGPQPCEPNSMRRYDAPPGQGAVPPRPVGMGPQPYGPDGARRFEAPNGQGAAASRPFGSVSESSGPFGGQPAQTPSAAGFISGPTGTQRQTPTDDDAPKAAL